jgi:hypothetical protein
MVKVDFDYGKAHAMMESEPEVWGKIVLTAD